MSKDKRLFPEASSTVGVGLLNIHECDLSKVLSLTSFNSSSAGLVVSSAYRVHTASVSFGSRPSRRQYLHIESRISVSNGFAKVCLGLSST